MRKPLATVRMVLSPKIRSANRARSDEKGLRDVASARCWSRPRYRRSGCFSLLFGQVVRGWSLNIYAALVPLCPRIEARQFQLEALQQGIDAIRPVFSQFESELTDVQKAKLGRVVNVSTEITSVVH